MHSFSMEEFAVNIMLLIIELSLLVDDEDNSISIPLAISVAPRFGIAEGKWVL